MFYSIIKTLKNLFIVLLLFFSIYSCNTNKAEIRPNILFIMADDHTSQAWGIYNGILDNPVFIDYLQHFKNKLNYLEISYLVEDNKNFDLLF